MSQANVEVVRGVMTAYASGDNESALSAFDPSVEFDASARPEGQVYRGRSGVAEAMRVWTGTWDDWTVEVEQIIDADDDRVLLVARQSGRGKGSGIKVELQEFQVWTFRNGSVVHWKGFLDRQEALEAAGLSE
jgi:ketosteroid isomerase-like protein